MEGDCKKRKPTRLKGCNYSANGSYFITICTEGRAEILSRIVGEGSPLPELSSYGEIADRYINLIENHYPNIRTNCYIIMPNHIHMILSIVKTGRGDPSPTIPSVIGWLKYQITKEVNQLNCMNISLFQRSFYDHVIRNGEDYEEIKKYILENPKNWIYDELYG